MGPTLSWSTELEIVDELRQSPKRAGKNTEKSGTIKGSFVALIWSAPEQQDDWDKTSVGDVQMVPASDLASSQPDYAELAALGETEIPTLILNREYAPLKQYISSRASAVEERTLEACRERYAVGVGVGLLTLDNEEQRRIRAREAIPEGWGHRAKDAVARGVLVMMPEFDALAREAGLDED
jgi:hypothetical protein